MTVTLVLVAALAGLTLTSLGTKPVTVSLKVTSKLMLEALAGLALGSTIGTDRGWHGILVTHGQGRPHREKREIESAVRSLQSAFPRCCVIEHP